jgi:hypothetical protein
MSTNFSLISADDFAEVRKVNSKNNPKITELYLKLCFIQNELRWRMTLNQLNKFHQPTLDELFITLGYYDALSDVDEEGNLKRNPKVRFAKRNVDQNIKILLEKESLHKLKFEWRENGKYDYKPHFSLNVDDVEYHKPGRITYTNLQENFIDQFKRLDNYLINKIKTTFPQALTDNQTLTSFLTTKQFTETYLETRKTVFPNENDFKVEQVRKFHLQHFTKSFKYVDNIGNAYISYLAKDFLTQDDEDREMETARKNKKKVIFLYKKSRTLKNIEKNK